MPNLKGFSIFRYFSFRYFSQYINPYSIYQGTNHFSFGRALISSNTRSTSCRVIPVERIFRSLPNVEDSGPHNAFVYQDVITGVQSRLHGVGGDAERSKTDNLQQNPYYCQHTYIKRQRQQFVFSFLYIFI